MRQVRRPVNAGDTGGSTRPNDGGRQLPEFANTRNNLGRLYLHLGRHDEAIAEFTRIGSRVDLAQANARAGNRAEAQRLLAELGAGPDRVSPLDRAMIHAALGETDAAFQQLERAYQERTPLLIDLKVNFALRPLHGDPRFQSLVARMKLPEAPAAPR
jgi:tetratricopeptide (TPR) repeat protein